MVFHHWPKLIVMTAHLTISHKLSCIAEGINARLAVHKFGKHEHRFPFRSKWGKVTPSGYKTFFWFDAGTIVARFGLHICKQIASIKVSAPFRLAFNRNACRP